MRLLLDECVPKRLKRELPGHAARTVQDLGWAGITNGALLKLANGQFGALLTVDQGIEYQQNLAGLASASWSWWPRATTSTTFFHYCQVLSRLSQRCDQEKSYEWVANIQMEPTRPMARAIMWPRRAAHLAR